jgi:hypothetical protein
MYVIHHSTLGSAPGICNAFDVGNLVTVLWYIIIVLNLNCEINV